MKRRLMAALAAAMATALAGCGAELDDGLGGDFPPTEPAAPVVPDAGPTPDADPVDMGPDADSTDMAPMDAGATNPGAEAFAGTWAHVQIQRGIAVLPVLGATVTETFGVMRMRIAPGDEAGTLQVELTICEVRIEREADIVVTEIPDSFVTALEPVVRTATFDALAFAAPWYTELRGVTLDDPDDDPLPTEADDPRVTDPDMDGNPGLTARVSGLVDGEVYLVQRSKTELTGTLDPLGTLDGRLGWIAEESVLGADDPLLAEGAPFEAGPDPDESVFLSTRIDDGQDCAWIRANQDLVFSR